jgi:hypothetical protein
MALETDIILNINLEIDRYIGGVGILKYWVGVEGSLDHLPIMIQLEKEEWNPLGPFKFNHN